MNIGDYVRTRDGNIFKIVGGNADNWEIDINFIKLEQTEENWYESNRYNDNGYWFNEENIIKSSPNIIDLIEVGDYVNGYPVEKVYQPINKEVGKKVRFATDNADGWEYEAKEIYEEDIKSIVTHEMFESMEYKVNKND